MDIITKKLLPIAALGLLGAVAAIYTSITLVLTLPALLFTCVKDQFKRLVSYLPHAIRKEVKIYDFGGLRHNIHHLEDISKEIPFWDIEKQAEYADLVTIKLVKSGTFYEIPNLMPLLENPIDYQRLNSTIIGNIAYIILNIEKYPPDDQEDLYANPPSPEIIKDCLIKHLENIRHYYATFT